MLLKILGLKYSSPSVPQFGEAYLSNFAVAASGDTLVDDDGNPITFGIIAIPFNDPPLDSEVDFGETKLWFEISTNTIWSKTKTLAGDVFTADLGAGGLAGSDFMLKPDYDSNDDGTVDAADQLKGNLGTTTADELRAHIDNALIHAQISDLLTNPGFLWSSTKISNELALKSNIGHGHAAFTNTADGFVPAPNDTDMAKILRVDGTWQVEPTAGSTTLAGLIDTDVASVATGEMLVFNGIDWKRTEIVHDTNIGVTYDAGLNQLAFDLVIPGSVS